MSMFKRRYTRRLEEEPITIKLSETETYTLRPMSITALPGRASAAKVFKMMSETKDFKNLIPFVQGLKMANMRVSPGRWEALMRHTRQNGQLSLILECARQPGRTGLLLRHVPLVQGFFFQLHRMAQEADFKGPEVTKALNMGKQAVDIMDADLPDHAYVSPAQNPKNNLGVIATLLDLSSARAINDFGGVDNEKDVVGYAQKLVANLPKDHFSAKAPTVEFDRQSAAKWMQEAYMVCSGLQMSLSVQDVAADKRLQNALTSRLAEVKEAIKTAVEDPKLLRFRTHTWRLARDLLNA